MPATSEVPSVNHLEGQHPLHPTRMPGKRMQRTRGKESLCGQLPREPPLQLEEAAELLWVPVPC